MVRKARQFVEVASKLVPVMVMTVYLLGLTVVGEMLVIVGLVAAELTVMEDEALVVVPLYVTVAVVVASEHDGETITIFPVSLLTTSAVLPHMMTENPDLSLLDGKPLPRMFSSMPPLVGIVLGDTDVMAIVTAIGLAAAKAALRANCLVPNSTRGLYVPISRFAEFPKFFGRVTVKSV